MIEAGSFMEQDDNGVQTFPILRLSYISFACFHESGTLVENTNDGAIRQLLRPTGSEPKLQAAVGLQLHAPRAKRSNTMQDLPPPCP